MNFSAFLKAFFLIVNCPACDLGLYDTEAFFLFSPGYEKYNSMRADPTLCFLERVGMPDAKAIAAEQRGADMVADGGEG